MFDIEAIIQTGGILLIAAIVFAESGLLIGFFLPGDTLLFTAGFFAAQGKLSLGWLLAAVVIAAIAGDNVGYTLGKRMGKRLFTRKDGILFRHDYIMRAEKFYEEHGGKTIILARFVPVIRTFAPVVAGAAKMDRKKFFAYNVIGGLSWGIGVTMLGYWLGSKIPNIDHYLLPMVLVATVFTFGPAAWHVLKDPKSREMIKTSLANKLAKIRYYLNLGQK